MSGPSVSVVIPTLNAGKYLPALMDALRGQKPAAPQEVILVDSNSGDNTVEIASRFSEARVVQVGKFSHGRARNMGARAAHGEFLALLTQDAVPADNTWLAELLAPLADPAVGAAYSRQVPREDANPMERFFLGDRFPDGPATRKTNVAGRPLMLEDVFFSNVSAVVRKDLLMKHPFDESLIMSEDQQFSRDIILAGCAVVYCPRSVVIHSHNYTLKSVFKRYFDSVYSLSKIFPAHGVATSAGMGFRYVSQEVRYIARRFPWHLPYYFFYTVAKSAGTLASHAADGMPKWMLRRLSLHNYHWGDTESLQAGEQATKKGVTE